MPPFGILGPNTGAEQSYQELHLTVFEKSELGHYLSEAVNFAATSNLWDRMRVKLEAVPIAPGCELSTDISLKLNNDDEKPEVGADGSGVTVPETESTMPEYKPQVGGTIKFVETDRSKHPLSLGKRFKDIFWSNLDTHEPYMDNSDIVTAIRVRNFRLLQKYAGARTLVDDEDLFMSLLNDLSRRGKPWTITNSLNLKTTPNPIDKLLEWESSRSVIISSQESNVAKYRCRRIDMQAPFQIEDETITVGYHFLDKNIGAGSKNNQTMWVSFGGQEDSVFARAFANGELDAIGIAQTIKRVLQGPK